MDAVLMKSLRLLLCTVQTDSSRKVRRSAAVSWLHAVQDRESPLAYQAVSLSEQLSTFSWHDPSGLAVAPPALVTSIAATTSQHNPLSAHGNRRYHEEYRQHLSRVAGCRRGHGQRGVADGLREWWSLMMAGGVCASDQVKFF